MIGISEAVSFFARPSNHRHAGTRAGFGGTRILEELSEGVCQWKAFLSGSTTNTMLQALEDDFPRTAWLPVICQNPAEAPLAW